MQGIPFLRHAFDKNQFLKKIALLSLTYNFFVKNVRFFLQIEILLDFCVHSSLIENNFVKTKKKNCFQ